MVRNLFRSKPKKQSLSYRWIGFAKYQQYKLMLEQLEDRCVPATVVVTGNGDNVAVDGLVTLREAILWPTRTPMRTPT